MGVPRTSCIGLDHFHTGFGKVQLAMHKWRLAPTSSCERDKLNQIAAHVVQEFPLHRSHTEYHRLQLVLDDEIRCWLNNVVANI